MSWEHVIVHHTAGKDSETIDTEAIRRFHVEGRGWRDVGYHFLVEKIGDRYHAIVGRPLDMPGAHAPGWNTKALGVALVGDFTETGPPQEQLECAARLVASLVKAFGMIGVVADEWPLTLENLAVIAHRQTKATACPGDAFPWPLFVEMVRELL
jgi:hypothetical protein